jgi:hypothetical protein
MKDTKLLQEMILKTDKRAVSFAIMLDHLLPLDNPIVIETGCARQEDNFVGDGMSTIIFDEYIKEFGGEFYSVDINPDNVVFVKERCAHTFSYCSDSVKFLSNLNEQLRKENRYVDLLYLDSYDLDTENPHPSSLHHIFELVAIMPSLRKGSMVVVDDNVEVINTLTNELMFVGKGDYVDQYFKMIGVEKLYNGYQWVWRL